jgi:hypothetical protein
MRTPDRSAGVQQWRGRESPARKGKDMAKNAEHFSVEKVKALRAYFLRLRNSSRGKPEYSDLDTTLKLCEQLIAVLQPVKSEKS